MKFWVQPTSGGVLASGYLYQSKRATLSLVPLEWLCRVCNLSISPVPVKLFQPVWSVEVVLHITSYGNPRTVLESSYERTLSMVCRMNRLRLREGVMIETNGSSADGAMIGDGEAALRWRRPLPGP